MYDVALSVLSCVRAGTDVHVAWMIDPDLGSEAVAFTPGGGKLGELRSGAFDQAVREVISGSLANGGLVKLPVGPAEALAAGLTEGSTVTIGVVPGESIPLNALSDMVERRPVEFELDLEGEKVVCSFDPLPRAVISGSGPIADALETVFGAAGWAATQAPHFEVAGGLLATLSAIDAAIIIGHDVEVSSRALESALGSQAGYIGSVGSKEMQRARERWLELNGVEWSQRVRGPAGIDIGASTPGEIAISIAAEAIAVTRGSIHN